MTVQQRRQNPGPGREQDRGGDSGAPFARRQENWQPPNRQSNGAPLASALGWFSIGLGVAQLVMPRNIATLVGIQPDQDNQALLRAVGVREIASGVGILSRAQPAGWVKARVGGDVMDLALLGAALNTEHVQTERVATAMAAVAGITALDWFCSQQLSEQAYPGQVARNQQGDPVDHGQPYRDQQDRGQLYGRAADARKAGVKQGIHVRKSITVNRTPEALYQFWHNFENLPRFMYHLEAVQVTGARRSQWRAKAPAGLTVEWEAETTEDRPHELIAWRSLAGATVPNAGSVRFTPAPGNRGTVVTVELQYDPPGGAVGVALAKLFGEEPEQQIQDDLRIFKQVLETGDVVRSEASLWGPSLAQRPAQPPSDKEYQQLMKAIRPAMTATAAAERNVA